MFIVYVISILTGFPCEQSAESVPADFSVDFHSVPYDISYQLLP